MIGASQCATGLRAKKARNLAFKAKGAAIKPEMKPRRFMVGVRTIPLCALTHFYLVVDSPCWTFLTTPVVFATYVFSGTLQDNFDGVSAIPERRRSKRAMPRVRASLSFLSLRGRAERIPCLIVDLSQDGFELQVGSGSGLRRGQLVDLILDEDPSKPVRCRVVWIGEPGSKQEGRAGLQTA